MAGSVVQVLSKARMLAIEAQAFVSAAIQNDELILTRYNGEAVNLGNVRGNPGNFTKDELWADPVLTGNPTAPTPATSDNDTSIATTAFVKAQVPAFQTYIPVVTASVTNPSLGNGTAVGRFHEYDKLVHFTAKIVFGSTSTFGSGVYSMNLPRPIATDSVLRCNVRFNDSNPGVQYLGTSFLASGSTFRLSALTDATYIRFNSAAETAPFTWGPGDEIEASGWYEKA